MEHLQRAWPTSVRELLETGVLLAYLSGFCAMVGSSSLVFGFFLGRLRDALVARTIYQTRAFIFTGVSSMDGSEGEWVVY